MAKNLKEYYQNRANEYELVYQKSERQVDLKKVHLYLEKAFENKNVFEIACGTGYWTETIAKACSHIVATDVNETALTIAKEKIYGQTKIDFEQLDLWELENRNENFDSVFGGFIWSHILKKDLPRFLNILEKQLDAKGALIFIDNKYVEGSNTPISRADEDGNTYQIRQLQNGEKYEVLKNFPSKEEVNILIKDLPFEMEWTELKYYWILNLKKDPKGPSKKQ